MNGFGFFWLFVINVMSMTNMISTVTDITSLLTVPSFTICPQRHFFDDISSFRSDYSFCHK